MKKLTSFTLALLIAVFAGCGRGEDDVSVPDNLISKDSMVSILVDFQLVEGALLDKQQQNETTYFEGIEYYTMIMKKHGITREDFKETLEFYSYHPKLYLQIYDLVIVELSQMESKNIQRKDNVFPGKPQ